MTDNERQVYTEHCYREALAKLNGYLKTGTAGLLQQAWDRLTAVDMELSRVTKDRAGALHLVEHLRQMGIS